MDDGKKKGKAESSKPFERLPSLVSRVENDHSIELKRNLVLLKVEIESLKNKGKSNTKEYSDLMKLREQCEKSINDVVELQKSQPIHGLPPNSNVGNTSRNKQENKAILQQSDSFGSTGDNFDEFKSDGQE
ncbi:hypothetical protein ACQ4LE_004041 [Meloidogyne hapla]